MSHSFYNTIHQSGTDLQQSESQAKNQEELIEQFMKQYQNEHFTPFDIQRRMKLHDTPITSIRRAMTNLTKKQKIIKTHEQKNGIYNKPNYTWVYKSEPKQISLF